MSGPLAALNQIDKIIFRGAKFHQNVAAAVTDASVSLGVDQVTDLSVTFADPHLDLALSNHITLGAQVLVEELMTKVSAIEVNPGPSGTGGMTFSSRSAGVAALRARQGALVMRNASPTDFVRAECKAVGLKVVAQTTEKRRQIKRDVKKKGSEGGDGAPSSWTTFQRLASESGFYVFEVAGTVYFGQPTWLIDAAQDVKVGWLNVDESIRALSVPTCRQSTDSTDGIEVTFEVPYTRSTEMRPGRAVNLIGMGRFSDRYLITSVDYSLAGLGPVSVTARTPKNPKKEKINDGYGNNGDGVTVRGVGKYAAVVNAARDAGFRGDALVTAVAIAIAESGGNPQAVSPLNSNGTRDYGLWQINSVHRSSGFDTTLGLSAEYNAKWAYKISSGGKNWRPWSTYWSNPFTSGAGQGVYRTHLSEARNAIEKSSVNSSVATEARGRKSAYDFVNICLRQAGDRYVYGAEVNLDDTNPNVFDCSELVQWATHQTGVYMPDGSGAQLAYCRAKGTVITIDQALATRGALLFLAHPGAAHVAVSLGSHQGTIEATNSYYGVRQWSTHRSFRWDAGALVPGMKY